MAYNSIFNQDKFEVLYAQKHRSKIIHTSLNPLYEKILLECANDLKKMNAVGRVFVTFQSNESREAKQKFGHVQVLRFGTMGYASWEFANPVMTIYTYTGSELEICKAIAHEFGHLHGIKLWQYEQSSDGLTEHYAIQYAEDMANKFQEQFSPEAVSA